MREAIERIREKTRVGCPFCGQWIAAPRRMVQVFTPDGCLGGRCSCGAAFAVDETGRSGGQALLDAQAVACEGDLDRAMALDSHKDFDVETRPYRAPILSVGRRPHVHSYLEPKVWFVKLKNEGTAGEREDLT